MTTTELLLADRRDDVIHQLTAGFAGSYFEVDELERRLALAHSAQSRGELDALVADLRPAAPSTALVPARPLRVIFGSIERRGPWTVPQNLSARVLFGNIELDLREARLAPGVTTIDVNVTMGNLEIIVPPGMAVEIDASSTLGNIEHESTPPSEPAGTVVRITGRVRLGNLEVGTRYPGERAGEARRRSRWERRMDRLHRKLMRRRHRHCLPSPTDW